MKQPHLGISEGDLPQSVLMVGNPDRVHLILEHLSGGEVLESRRGYIVGVGRSKIGNNPIGVVCHGLGSSSTALVMEECYRVGVRDYIRVGSAGALQQRIQIGDLVIASGAVRDEGTTPRMAPIIFPAIPSLEILNALQEASQDYIGNTNVHTGLVWTSDIFYLDLEEYKKWMALNVLAVEMEASVVFIFSYTHSNCRSGAILAVDGNLETKKMKGEDSTSTEDNPEFLKGVDNEIKIAIQAIDILQEHEKQSHKID